MLFGTGEILQGRAEGLCRHHAQVDLQAAAKADRHLGIAAGHDIGHSGIGGQRIHHRVRLTGDGQQVQVAHGLPSAPIAAGPGHLLDGRAVLQVRGKLLDV